MAKHGGTSLSGSILKQLEEDICNQDGCQRAVFDHKIGRHELIWEHLEGLGGRVSGFKMEFSICFSL